jgi:hypothetical protein
MNVHSVTYGLAPCSALTGMTVLIAIHVLVHLVS